MDEAKGRFNGAPENGRRGLHRRGTDGLLDSPLEEAVWSELVSEMGFQTDSGI